jgi:hypothetical protein
MSDQDTASTAVNLKPNGSGMAAVFAAGAGSFAVAFLALLADKATGFKSMMSFYPPTGPLSGVTTLAIAVWLIVWTTLHMRWRGRAVSVAWTHAALVFLVLSLLLTFPPIADLF